MQKLVYKQERMEQEIGFHWFWVLKVWWFNCKILVMKLKVKSWKSVVCLMLSLFFVGCSTSKYVPAPTYITDTSKDVSIDTTLNERFIQAFEALSRIQLENRESKVKETTQEKDSVAPRYDVNGKKTGEDHFYSKVMTIETSEVSSLKETISHLQSYKDSTSLYKKKIDSLMEEKSKDTPYYIYKEKKFNVIQQALMVIGGVFC